MSLRDRIQEAANHIGRLSDLKERRVSTIREAYAHAQEIVLAAIAADAAHGGEPLPSSQDTGGGK